MNSQPAQDRPVHRIALELEYDGSSFCGWQRQAAPELPTVQDRLEQALSSIVGERIAVFCSGRTDKGVHASGQVVHFDTPIDRGAKAWVVGSNSLLPSAIRVKWAHNVPGDFHARFSAKSRRYLYLLYESRIDSAHFDRYATRVSATLDVRAMHEAGQYLLGENDFSAFRAAGCQSRSPWRAIHWLNVERRNRLVVVDIQANAFLQHMVRNIVGMLLEVGQGAQPPAWAGELLVGRDRTAGAATASARGLFFVRADYPEEFGLPQSPLGPLFLQPYP